MTGTDQVLGDLARDRGRELVAYAYLLTGDHAAAQDLVQDAFVKVFGRVRAHPGPQSAEAYVRRTILTLYIDGFRRRRRWTSMQHLLVDDGPASRGGEPGVDQQVDLARALATLSPQERACVVLRFYEDLTVPAVAGRLGLADGTVKRYLSTAVHKLEHRLGPVAAPDVETVAVEPPRR